MDAEKLMMQRRIDNLQQHIDHLYGELRDAERREAKLTVELDAVKRERDAAIQEMRDGKFCRACVRRAEKTISHSLYDVPSRCIECQFGNSGFEWHGVQESGEVEG